MTILNRLVNFILKRRKLRKFHQEWKMRNKQNYVEPIKEIDINRVKIGRFSYGALDLTAYNKRSNSILVIGNYVSISSGVKFFLDEQHQFNTFTTFPLKSVFLNNSYPEDAVSKGSIIIEDEVWIGAESIILSGVRIGKGAIIATGSIVTKDVEPYSVVGGVPAKIIKNRFNAEIVEKLMQISLIEIPAEDILENLDLFYEKLNLDVLKKIECLKYKNK